jgi:hypothetical protein
LRNGNWFLWACKKGHVVFGGDFGVFQECGVKKTPLRIGGNQEDDGPGDEEE